MSPPWQHLKVSSSAPLAEHALPVQIQGIVVAENLAKSHHWPTIYPPFTHDPWKAKWFFWLFQSRNCSWQMQTASRTRWTHRGGMPPAPELHRSGVFGGVPHGLYPKCMVYDGKFWWKILLNLINDLGTTLCQESSLKWSFSGDPVVLYMHNDITSHFWRYLRFNWKWTTLITLWWTNIAMENHNF